MRKPVRFNAKGVLSAASVCAAVLAQGEPSHDGNDYCQRMSCAKREKGTFYRQLLFDDQRLFVRENLERVYGEANLENIYRDENLVDPYGWVWAAAFPALDGRRAERTAFEPCGPHVRQPVERARGCD